MSITFRSKSSSRRSAGVLLLAGVIAGVTVGGGVGVFAASSTNTVTVCVDKEDNHMNYSKNGKCKSHQIKLVLNQAGTNGATGATGAKGETGAAGTNGATGATGETGAAGSSGSGGGATAPVATGTNCVATKCTYKIGDTGPGGGIIFFVDYNDQHTNVDYLEAAPVGWGNGMIVNQGGVSGETTGTATEDPKMKWCSTTNTGLGLDASDKIAVGSGASNTATAATVCTGGAIQASADYAGGSKSDWSLPSGSEAMLMYPNLRQMGVGFSNGGYWSSSEFNASNAWFQSFSNGDHVTSTKNTALYVRPVRAF